MNKGKEVKAHIGIFGKINVGKSSFINTLAGQEVAIVSEKPGTTTDPVKKSMEITGVGAVILIDTAGIDDSGELGKLRTGKTKQTISIIDLAILLITDNTLGKEEKELISEFVQLSIPFFLINNKSDVAPLEREAEEYIKSAYSTDILDFSTCNPNTEKVYTLIAKNLPETSYQHTTIIGDLIEKGDMVLLITPIDSEAPEGRMILPQVQLIRDILDNDCIATVLKENEVEEFLLQSKLKPKLAITDSQVFDKANAMIPPEIPLSSFSIVLARHKGNFKEYLVGVNKIAELENGDKILMLESCTHQITCEDIGRFKIPAWMKEFTGKELEFDILAGLDALPDNLMDYALLIQCGGCMVTEIQIKNRLKGAIDKGVLVTNYGMTIAYLKGIYHRAIAPFPEAQIKM